jgi:DNA excision repair protein ERCC-2
VQIDLDKRTIRVGVRELLALGDGARRRTGASSLRAAMGSEVHASYAERRAAEYGDAFTAERSVVLELEVDGFSAEIAGRIDGELDRGESIELEEVKSELESGTTNLDAATQQVCTYALALARGRGGEAEERPIHTSVVIVSIVDGAERSVPVAFVPANTEARLAELLRGAIAVAEGARTRARGRQRWAQGLVFPHEGVREGQTMLINAIAEAVFERRPLLVEAPTGTGKTAASLFGALQSACERGSRVFYATAKTTQHEHVGETFEALCSGSARGAQAGAEPGTHVPPFAVSLHARARVCRTSGRPCNPRECTRFNQHDQRAPLLLDALPRSHAYLGIERLTAAAEAHQVCPYELAFDLAGEADLVIGDFNHAFDGAFSTGQDAAETVVVVDEAHNLFDRARGYNSARLAAAGLDQARSFLPPTDPLAPSLVAWLDEVGHCIAGAAASAAKADAGSGERLVFDDSAELNALPEGLESLARRAQGLALRWFASSGTRTRFEADAGALDPVAESLLAVNRIRSASQAEPETRMIFAASAQARGGAAIGVHCLDPGPALARRHSEFDGLVAMSGTLTPMEYWRDVLGLAALDAQSLRVPSAFEGDQRRVVLVPTISTAARDRAGSLGAVIQIVLRTVALQPGPYILFFPSFAYLEAARARLQDGAEGLGRVFVQSRRSSLARRMALLDSFRKHEGPRVLLAVSGGVFGEGIDLPGAQLLGAIIVGPCLPPVSFERAAMSRAFENTRQAGFAYAMLYPGLQRVVQAAGRVIRTEQDRGVIVLIGSRFARPEVIACLPEDWYSYDPIELVPEDPIAALRSFWEW